MARGAIHLTSPMFRDYRLSSGNLHHRAETSNHMTIANKVVRHGNITIISKLLNRSSMETISRVLLQTSSIRLNLLRLVGQAHLTIRVEPAIEVSSSIFLSPINMLNMRRTSISTPWLLFSTRKVHTSLSNSSMLAMMSISSFQRFKNPPHISLLTPSATELISTMERVLVRLRQI